MKKGFVPIKLNEFVEKHIKSNPNTSRKEIETGLKAALNDYKSGVKCDCDNPNLGNWLSYHRQCMLHMYHR